MYYTLNMNLFPLSLVSCQLSGNIKSGAHIVEVQLETVRKFRLSGFSFEC